MWRKKEQLSKWEILKDIEKQMQGEMGRQLLQTNIQRTFKEMVWTRATETTRKFRQQYLSLFKIRRYTVTGYSSMSIFIFQLAEIIMREREVKTWKTHSWRFIQPKYSSLPSEMQGHSFHLNKREGRLRVWVHEHRIQSDYH